MKKRYFIDYTGENDERVVRYFTTSKIKDELYAHFIYNGRKLIPFISAWRLSELLKNKPVKVREVSEEELALLI